MGNIFNICNTCNICDICNKNLITNDYYNNSNTIYYHNEYLNETLNNDLYINKNNSYSLPNLNKNNNLYNHNHNYNYYLIETKKYYYNFHN